MNPRLFITALEPARNEQLDSVHKYIGTTIRRTYGLRRTNKCSMPLLPELKGTFPATNEMANMQQFRAKKRDSRCCPIIEDWIEHSCDHGSVYLYCSNATSRCLPFLFSFSLLSFLQVVYSSWALLRAAEKGPPELTCTG